MLLKDRFQYCIYLILIVNLTSFIGEKVTAIQGQLKCNNEKLQTKSEYFISLVFSSSTMQLLKNAKGEVPTDQ